MEGRIENGADGVLKQDTRGGGLPNAVAILRTLAKMCTAQGDRVSDISQDCVKERERK